MSDDEPDGIERENVTAYEWVDILSRVQFGTIVIRPAAKPGGRPVTVTGRMIKAIAWRLAFYADPNGTQVRPGPARLAVVCEADYKTVKAVYGVLRGLGLLTQTAYARGPQAGRLRTSDEYRLTIPTNLLDRVQVLSPLEMDREIERVRNAGRGTRLPGVRGNHAPPNPDDPHPVDNPELGGTGHPPTEHPDEKVGGNGVPAENELGGTGHPHWGEPRSRIPTKTYQREMTNHDLDPAQPPDAQAPNEPETAPPDIPPPRMAGATS